METLEIKLTEATTEMKTFALKAQDEIKSLGTVTTETKTALDVIKTQLGTMQTQLDAVDAKTQQRHAPGGAEQKSLGDMVTTHEDYAKAQDGGGFASGHGPIRVNLKSSAFPFERKTDILNTALGVQTTGTIPLVRLPGIVGLPMQALRIRDVMNVITQTTGNSFDFVYQSTRTNLPSPQAEGQAKAQSYYNWQSTSGQIRTIAHFINVSRQALDDVAWLRGQIDSELTYGLKVKEEADILSGDGLGIHLNGIIPQATTFDTSVLVAAAGWTRLDVLRYAKLQARLAGLATYAPSAFVMHPTDMAKLELTKDSYGRYIIGDPSGGEAVKLVWGLPVVESDSISVGQFLVGAFANAADIIDRAAVSIEISYEHSSNFTSNLATILCEERIGLAVKKANAFIAGLFTTSPATT